MKWTSFSFLAILFGLVLVLGHPCPGGDGINPVNWGSCGYWRNSVAAGRPERQPHLVFSPEGRISGSTGCNRLTGTYQLDGKALKFSPLAMTKMACPPPLDAQERAFIQAINAIVSVRESGRLPGNCWTPGARSRCACRPAELRCSRCKSGPFNQCLVSVDYLR